MMEQVTRFAVAAKRYVLHRTLFFSRHREQLKYVSTRVVAKKQRLEQIQLKWFDCQRRTRIKVYLFISSRTQRLLSHWFKLKKKTPLPQTRREKIRRLSIEMMFGPNNN